MSDPNDGLGFPDEPTLPQHPPPDRILGTHEHINVAELIRDIEQNTRPDVSPTRFWQTVVDISPYSGSGTQDVLLRLGHRYLFVQPVPCEVRVYMGPAKRFLLASLRTGDSVTIELPLDTTAITLEWLDTFFDTTQQIRTVFSSRQLEPTIHSAIPASQPVTFERRSGSAGTVIIPSGQSRSGVVPAAAFVGRNRLSVLQTDAMDGTSITLTDGQYRPIRRGDGTVVTIPVNANSNTIIEPGVLSIATNAGLAFITTDATALEQNQAVQRSIVVRVSD